MKNEQSKRFREGFSELRDAAEKVSDEDAGKALKAVLRYFSGQKVKPEEMTAGACALFNILAVLVAAKKQP